MPVAVVCASHSPLKDYRSPPGDVAERVSNCLKDVRAAVSAFQPELVVCFGPDHYNGFFYHLMPSFCIGTSVDSVGDWATPAGAVPVAGEKAGECVRYLHEHDVDAAISHRMTVDHGFTQLLTQLFEWQTLPETLPVFINCAAPPLPPLKRVLKLGQLIGGFVSRLEAQTQTRVLITASGGLSHDPPIPQLSSAPEPVRERLIAGGPLSAEAREARQQKVLNDADLQLSGDSAQRPLNPSWDAAFLSMFASATFDALLAQSDAEITAAAGCGGHEVRTWVAARAALSAITEEQPACNFYDPVPAWVAGFGVATFGLDLNATY